MNSNLKNEISKELKTFIARVSAENISSFIQLSDDEVIPFTHFGLGTFIRNNILRSGSKIKCAFLKEGVYDLDEMSAVIIFEWHKELCLHKDHSGF